MDQLCPDGGEAAGDHKFLEVLQIISNLREGIAAHIQPDRAEEVEGMAQNAGLTTERVANRGCFFERLLVLRLKPRA